MNRKIIAIDDDSNILKSYRTILNPELTVADKLAAKRKGTKAESNQQGVFDLATADHGEAAYELAKEAFDAGEPFSVAFIDMRMPPGWDGLKTAKALRELDDRIYIVIVTAYSEYSSEEMQNALQHDILLLRKPFVSEEIKQMASNLCNSWDRDRQLEYRTAEWLQASKLTTVGEMASGMIHEINSPLSTIIFSCHEVKEILSDGPTDEDLEEFPSIIERINHNAFRIDKLVKHLLRFVRKQDIVKIEIDFAKVIENTMLMYGKKITNNSIDFNYKIAEDLKPVNGDPHQIEQILINLINNSIDAMDGCSNKKLDILINNQTEEEGVEIRVKDNGSGMSEEVREQIFFPFFTTKAVDRGTGLGLSVLKNIIEEHSGTIECESAEGEGTTFIICLPANPPEKN